MESNAYYRNMESEEVSPLVRTVSEPTPSPDSLRKVFGDNLRALSASHRSVAGLCRDLGINRTQFNRYLSGESFPRPDVLHRICQFFGTDARILLEPVRTLKRRPQSLLSHPALDQFFGDASRTVPAEMFPSGFYRFARRSFIDPTHLVTGLVLVYRQDSYTIVRGYEPREAMAHQGLDTDGPNREFRGFVLQEEQGIVALVSRRGAMTCSMNFLCRTPSIQNNLWEGFAARSIRESNTSQRAARMIYEFLGPRLPGNRARIMEAARKSGFCRPEALPPFQRRLLRLDEPFN